MKRTNSGKYLLLVGPKDAPRALLFGPRHDYLAELEHNDMAVDDLIRVGAPCPAPEPLTCHPGLGLRIDPSSARCWRLADW
ncbi:hypothetical protein OOT46_15415 [Aquabacterium sp. A7-Y]|uniref:hypothetical protein n=1 Tax=Aquabacterium sp. A7-Y TaxID=1349605 RepID=UPI00223D2976|nr:hypothetical protein [Aquabacterium sp. A7-Y]MCW7539232.1 hypothetical protein [Aquabacterium sp. A7-Y]